MGKPLSSFEYFNVTGGKSLNPVLVNTLVSN